VPKTKAILFVTPEINGIFILKKEVCSTAALVKKHDLFLISDEVYH
jgi:aspartate/methionine/tyrosine aminotransferase